MLPDRTQILSVAERYEKIMLYAIVPEDTGVFKMFSVRVIGTKQPGQIEGYTFLGTVKLGGGQLMFHIFYKQHESYITNGPISGKTTSRNVP